ncbi:MAG: U-box domain-containing protein [Anaerolineae bacterium]
MAIISNNNREALANFAYQHQNDPIARILECPLSQEIMEKPVVDKCGHSFEQGEIMKVVNRALSQGKQPQCPLSGQPLEGSFIPNLSLKKVIDDLTNEIGKNGEIVSVEDLSKKELQERLKLLEKQLAQATLVQKPALEKKNRNAEEKNKGLEKKVAELTEQLETKEKENTDLKKEKEEAKKENFDLKQELIDEQQKYNDLKANAKKIIKDKNKEIDKLEEKVERVKKQLKAKKKEQQHCHKKHNREEKRANEYKKEAALADKKYKNTWEGWLENL